MQLFRIATRCRLASVLFLFLLAVGSPAPALADPGTADPVLSRPLENAQFGAVEAYTAPIRARETGVTWERAIFRWDQFQPNSPMEWEGNPLLSDSDLALELAEGRKVVGVVLGTPYWMWHDPNAAPHNLDLPFDSPDNYWGQFMRRLAYEYRGRIDDWIIWNEPDIWNNSARNQQWNGSVEQYYQLVKVAYQATRAANPNSRVILAGLTYWWDQQFGREQYLRRFLNVASADPTARANRFYFDVASLHLYGNPRDLYDIPRYFRTLMQQYGLEKPIWINETNAVPWDDAGIKLGRDSYRVSMDEQASYLIQAFASALAAGVERVSVYKMQDDVNRPGAEPYGLVRCDPGASTRASYEAFQVISRYMSGSTSARLYRQGSVTAVRLERGRDWVTVLWNLSPAQVQVPVPARSAVATMVDKFGHSMQLSPRDGKYFMDLAGATANTLPGDPTRFHIGGSPLLLVEDKGQAVGSRVATQDWSAPGVNVGYSWVSPVTGYAVSGEWLDYYRARGGADVFSDPIGSVRLDPAGGGRVVQYFRNTVLEWHPENPPEYRIERRLLGSLLGPASSDPAVAPDDARLRPQGDTTYFPNEPGQGLGHYVANYAPDGSPTHFKEYFDRYGGANTFGYPMEEPKLRNGRWTQRFQGTVLESLSGVGGESGGPAVRLEPLGQQILDGLELPVDW